MNPPEGDPGEEQSSSSASGNVPGRRVQTLRQQFESRSMSPVASSSVLARPISRVGQGRRPLGMSEIAWSALLRRSGNGASSAESNLNPTSSEADVRPDSALESHAGSEPPHAGSEAEEFVPDDIEVPSEVPSTEKRKGLDLPTTPFSAEPVKADSATEPGYVTIDFFDIPADQFEKDLPLALKLNSEKTGKFYEDLTSMPRHIFDFNIESAKSVEPVEALKKSILDNPGGTIAMALDAFYVAMDAKTLPATAVAVIQSLGKGHSLADSANKILERSQKILQDGRPSITAVLTKTHDDLKLFTTAHFTKAERHIRQEIAECDREIKWYIDNLSNRVNLTEDLDTLALNPAVDDIIGLMRFRQENLAIPKEFTPIEMTPALKEKKHRFLKGVPPEHQLTWENDLENFEHNYSKELKDGIKLIPVFQRMQKALQDTRPAVSPAFRDIVSIQEDKGQAFQDFSELDDGPKDEAGKLEAMNAVLAGEEPQTRDKIDEFMTTRGLKGLNSGDLYLKLEAKIISLKPKSVIQLHRGEPGTGKTFSMNAVADLYGATLAEIELGGEGADVNSQLRLNFPPTNKPWPYGPRIEKSKLTPEERLGVLGYALMQIGSKPGIIFRDESALPDFENPNDSKNGVNLQKLTDDPKGPPLTYKMFGPRHISHVYAHAMKAQATNAKLPTFETQGTEAQKHFNAYMDRRSDYHYPYLQEPAARAIIRANCDVELMRITDMQKVKKIEGILDERNPVYNTAYEGKGAPPQKIADSGIEASLAGGSAASVAYLETMPGDKSAMNEDGTILDYLLASQKRHRERITGRGLTSLVGRMFTYLKRNVDSSEITPQDLGKVMGAEIGTIISDKEATIQKPGEVDPVAALRTEIYGSLNSWVHPPIMKLQTDLQALRTTVDYQGSNLGNIGTDITGVKAELKDLTIRTDLGALQTTMSHQSSQLGEISTDLTDLKTDLQELLNSARGRPGGEGPSTRTGLQPRSRSGSHPRSSSRG